MIARPILYIFAFVCFLFAAWQHTSPIWNRIAAVGAAAYVLAGLL